MAEMTRSLSTAVVNLFLKIILSAHRALNQASTTWHRAGQITQVHMSCGDDHPVTTTLRLRLDPSLPALLSGSWSPPDPTKYKGIGATAALRNLTLPANRNNPSHLLLAWVGLKSVGSAGIQPWV